MSWLEDALERLSKQTKCGYHYEASSDSEPLALCAMALVGHGRGEQARLVTDKLAVLQADNGSVGIRSGEQTPRWPTSLAVLAWLAVDDQLAEAGTDRVYVKNVERSLVWMLGFEAKTGSERVATVGHDVTLLGWPWVEGTHSWIEPTAFAVLALKSAGHWHHDRTRQGVRLLLDRQLPAGGCNYGNTSVLGQMLRPHIQPTGIALLALAGEADGQNRVKKSLTFLTQRVSAQTATASLAWSTLGLSACDRTFERDASWLEAAYVRTCSGDQSSYKYALLALAALGRRSPLVTLPLKAEDHD